ncbi:ABC transporter substrate-binding protein [Periweissella fabalis]|uniref:Oligopeptide ABC transporter substrate-binding protein n=1 Tax=Periweissella fabalis TaxID=1070421 RepID=A0A7X6N2F0_9LACO|nr:ABC transporter substrate-binding protein [Periweissella fabalis]MCM0599878.1 oligopeptide ABC transporter substrate-binding protein [Periweissella fabalis]NKZ24067.1 oligopeptide ABC transporter substrate-binding protein [Periweissella fabalis]
MKRATKYIIGSVTIGILSMVLAGCSSSNTNNNQTASLGNLKINYDNKKQAISNGTLNIGLVQDTPFQGIFSPTLLNTTADSTLLAPTGGSLFKTTTAFKIIDGGAANIKLDKETKTATITLHKGLTWSDGKAVIAKDLEFPYEIIANPAYQAQQYSDSYANIVGMTAYHNGQTKTITGITYPKGPNGNILQIKFNHMTPGMWQSGSGYYFEGAEPYHYLKNIKPANLAASKEIRQAPLGYGPYKVSKINAGQSVLYVPNPYYYGTKPKLKLINASVVSTATAQAALKDKKYDIMYNLPTTAYPAIKALPDYVQTGNQSLRLSYLDFNLGHYDSNTSMNIMDRKTPLQSIALRQAIGYAMNVDQVTQKFDNGLNQRLRTSIVPVFKGAINTNIKGYPLNINKANQLLDNAGFKWNPKHEYRLTPEGKPFKLTFVSRASDANTEAISQNYIQQWKQVGINVGLYHGRLTDFNTWVQMMMGGTNNDWDFTIASNSGTSDPSQIALFGKGTQYNIGHFTTPKFSQLQAKIDSPAAIDPAVRKQALFEYQKYVQNNVPFIPLTSGLDWIPVNQRVIGYTNDVAASQELWANIAVSASKTK